MIKIYNHIKFNIYKMNRTLSYSSLTRTHSHYTYSITLPHTYSLTLHVLNHITSHILNHITAIYKMASGRVKYSSPSILSSLWLWLCLLILTVEILSPSQSQFHYEDWKPLLGLNPANATSVNRNLADHNAGRPEKHRAKHYLSGKLLHTFNGTSTFQLQRELQACGDISPNPGPKGKPNLKYPCSECHKSVR